ncbi:MAG: tail fiber protein [Thermoleophilia bacterium]|nr:tail fiber protein [Thermoleophilia bacterium]
MSESMFTWATVTAINPLRIRLDGDASALPFTPDSLTDPLLLAVSDRVRCEISNNRPLILGTSGGPDRIVEVPAGIIAPAALAVAPSGWLLCDGSAVSRTTYADLFDALNPVVGTATVTLASPGVFTRTAHGLFTGQQVYLTTTGALPTGLAQNTNYWAIRVTADTFRLATSLANALAGTAINTSGSQSGTHTVRRTFGVGNGSSTFNVPDLKGRTVVGVDTGQTEFDALGETGGAKTHTLSAAEMPVHSHGTANGSGSFLRTGTSSQGNANWVGTGASFGYDLTTGNAGSGSAHNNLQPYAALNFIIKT